MYIPGCNAAERNVLSCARIRGLLQVCLCCVLEVAFGQKSSVNQQLQVAFFDALQVLCLQLRLEQLPQPSDLICKGGQEELRPRRHGAEADTAPFLQGISGLDTESDRAYAIHQPARSQLLAKKRPRRRGKLLLEKVPSAADLDLTTRQCRFIDMSRMSFGMSRRRLK